MAKKLNQAVIINRASQGNNFGDRTFQVEVELRSPKGEVVATKVFQDTAQEGEHGSIKRLMTMSIKTWAKENSGRFTGSV